MIWPKDFINKIICGDNLFVMKKMPDESIDMAITSPPYYDSEEYSDEPTNSLNRYRCFEAWRNGFYIPMIQKTMDALKSGGVFVLNIGSRQYPLNEALMDSFGDKYNIEKYKNLLSGQAGFLKSGEGESFYIIRKE